SAIKNQLSTGIDNFTPKYGTYSDDRPRRLIFIGTCNEHSPLRDETGNRRFLPVCIPSGWLIDLAWLRTNVDQLVAEAAHLEAKGESFAIPRDLWPDARAHQEDARAVSAVEELFKAWLDIAFPAEWKVEGVYITSKSLIDALTMARQRSVISAPVLEKLG